MLENSTHVVKGYSPNILLTNVGQSIAVPGNEMSVEVSHHSFYDSHSHRGFEARRDRRFNQLCVIHKVDSFKSLELLTKRCNSCPEENRFGHNISRLRQ
jgi:hypothetical protein